MTTNNPTIDGVSRELLERLLTDACNENWSDLNELLHSPDACWCRRFGKDNPHWPCPVHSAQGDPTAAMTEAGCQAYMDADGMIGIMDNSSMGHAYVAMRTLDPELAALQSTIAHLQARIGELESGRGEPVAYTTIGMLEIAKRIPLTGRIGAKVKKDDRWNVPLYTSPQTMLRNAQRYEYLRKRDLETIINGGVFAGMTPENLVLNGEDLDAAIDARLDATAALNKVKS